MTELTEPTADDRSIREIGTDILTQLAYLHGKLDAFIAMTRAETGSRTPAEQTATTTKENTMTSPATGFAHPIDEPCPEGCPTRLDEIASYVTECHGAGITVTADDVREALACPPEARDEIQRQIAEIAATWA